MDIRNLRRITVIFSIIVGLPIITFGQRIKLGDNMPNISSLTLEGKEIRIIDIVKKNKFTLIDFWASWCIPCREELPSLKEIYAKYHNQGLEIIGIALDSKIQNWRNAIEYEKIMWYNLSELNGRGESAAQIFGVNPIPASLLVDQKGKILAIDIPSSELVESQNGSLRGSNLPKVLEKLFNKDKWAQ